MHNEQEIRKIFEESKSKSDASKALYGFSNGSALNRVNSLIKQYNIDISHFDRGASKKTLYPKIIKKCPVCDKDFETQEGHPKQKRTCSYGCANSHFRTKEGNGQYALGVYAKNTGTSCLNGYGTVYRALCFNKYDYKCALCDWTKVVEVHHLDENHYNNDIRNLIPLCPNHHKLTTMVKFKEETQKEIELWLQKQDFSV